MSTLERTGPRRITDLAAIEGVTQLAMTVLIRVLEVSGMVERRADPTDKRAALVAVTEIGTSYVASRRRAGADAFVQLIGKLTDDEVAALIAAIPALEHLRELDGQEREPPSRSPGMPVGGSTVSSHEVAVSPFRQPRAVWAVAIAVLATGHSLLTRAEEGTDERTVQSRSRDRAHPSAIWAPSALPPSRHERAVQTDIRPSSPPSTATRNRPQSWMPSSSSLACLICPSKSSTSWRPTS